MRRLACAAVIGCLAAPLAFAQEEMGPPAPKDSFTEALVSAYETNPRLKSQREEVKALDEGVSEAMSGWRPSVSADYQKGRRRVSVSDAEWEYGDTRTRQLSVEQPLFSGGEVSGQIAGAKSRMKAGRARLESVEQEVLLDAIRAYAEVAEKSAVLDLTHSNVDVLTKHLENTRTRLSVGEVTRTDVLQSESRLARAQSEMQRAEGDLASAQAAFERVVGFKPGTYNLPENGVAIPASLEEARALATSDAPVLKEAQFTEKAAGSNIDVRTARILPRVSLEGTLNRSEGTNVPGIRSFDQDRVVVHVAIPLYQGGGEYSRLRAAKKRYEEARFESADALSATMENVTKSWHDYQASLAAIDSQETAVDAAQSALEGVRVEYNNGERTTLDVLDAEQEVFSNRVALVRARRDKTVLAYGLLAAAGKLNAKALALPVEYYDPIAHYDTVKWLPVGF